MKTSVALFVFTSIVASMNGCGGDDTAAMDSVDCGSDAPKFADVAIFNKCTMCHSSSLSADKRNGAPADINFDTYAAAEPHAQKAVAEVKDGSMPPKGSGVSVTDAEKQSLYKWEMCGAEK